MNPPTDCGADAGKIWSRPFAVLALCNLLVFINLHMILPTLPSYVKHTFRADDWVAGSITSVFAFTAIISRLFAAKVVQKQRNYSIVVWGLAVTILSGAGYLWTDGIVWVLLFRAFSGIGFGITSTLFATMATDVLPYKRMGEGMGIFGLSISIAMSVGPLIGLRLLNEWGMEPLMTASMAAPLLALGLLPLVRPLRTAGGAPLAAAENKDSGQAFALLSVPMLLNLLLAVVHGGIISFLALYGVQAGIAHVSLFFLIFTLAIVSARAFVGRWDDRFGNAGILTAGAVSVIACVLFLSSAASLWSILAGSICYGIGYGSIRSCLQTWMVKAVPVSKRGLANGMYFNSLDFGVASGAMLLGLVASFTGYAAMYRYSSLLMIAFLACLLVQAARKKRFIHKRMDAGGDA
ncbi:MFS transporter [Paenibacillus sp. MBLB4367]|uniref:MFS transporter n=1 Tax=Paenibacillus sp. MBLB4367 TaxID=3384767 RepID=UPI0039082143